MILRLIAENVGPFKKLDVDFSESGKPHLGPHIFAGVNGSGKSTVLKAIAWTFAEHETSGFPHGEWLRFLTGDSRAAVLWEQGGEKHVRVVYVGSGETLDPWIRQHFPGMKQTSQRSQRSLIAGIAAHLTYQRTGVRPPRQRPEDLFQWADFAASSSSGVNRPVPVFAYASSKALKHLEVVDLTISSEPVRDSLAFHGTVQNDAVQAWLVTLFSQHAIARTRLSGRQPIDWSKYDDDLRQLNSALSEVCGEKVELDLELEPSLQPRVLWLGQRLDFTQLPDGLRNTVGWVTDYLRRISQSRTENSGEGVLLLDEPDAHLHPLWQRRLLPGMRRGLKTTQIIATSHSPFVISSCPDAKIHVLTLQDGVATAQPPTNAPVGESVTTTLKEIFGVYSRFDIKTEEDIRVWNDLKKKEATSRIEPEERERLSALTAELSERSEELRSIVASDLTLNAKSMANLLSTAPGPRLRGRSRR